MNQKYKGWGIEFFGSGYRLTRMRPVDGFVITKTADTLARAKIIIANTEAEIRRNRRNGA